MLKELQTCHKLLGRFWPNSQLYSYLHLTEATGRDGYLSTVLCGCAFIPVKDRIKTNIFKTRWYLRSYRNIDDFNNTKISKL